MKSTPSKLGDAIDILSGFAYPAELFNDDVGIPVIRIRDVVRGFSETRYSGPVEQSYVINNGEILIGMDGNFNAARWCGGPALLNQRVCRVKARPNVLDEGYLFHLLPRALKKIEDSTAFVTVKHLSVKGIRDIDVDLPPLAEQRRIAAILDQADALRAKRREALEQLDSLTQSIFIEMFGDPVENPKNFSVKRLIDVIDSTRPITYGILMPGDDVDVGVKYVRVVDMKRGGIELSGIRKTTPEISSAFRRSVLTSGDLLMSIRGHVGRLAMVPPELNDANITQDTVRLAVSGASPVYVREYLRSLGIQRWMAKHTKGMAVRGINLGDLKSMPITLPPRHQQDDFAERANALENLTAVQRKSFAEFDTLFASLQYRAFRGEL